MDYSSLTVFYTFYDSMIRNAALSYSLILAKAIMSLLLLLQYARFYFQSNHSGREGLQLTLYDLIRPFLLVTFIIAYSYIMDSFDDMARTAESYVYSSFQSNETFEKILSGIDTKTNTQSDPEMETSVLGEVAIRIAEISNLLQHPSILLIKFMVVVTSFLDYVIYTFAIIIRFGSLFVLRFLGPIVLGLSVYARFELWWIKWITAYGLLYLWVICLFLINFFASTIALGVYKILANNGNPDIMTGLSVTSTMTVLVAVKCYFYFRSKVLLQKIFQ